MNIIEGLNTLAREANEAFPDLNSGGCAVFASIVANVLQSRFAITSVGVVADSFGGGANIEEARERIPADKRGKVREWNRNGVQFGHVALEFQHDGATWIYETEAGAVLEKSPAVYLVHKYWEITHGRLTMAEIDALASEQEGWNRMFDRDEIPAIKRLVESTLSNVEA